MCYSTLHTAMSVMELLHIFCIGHSAAPHTGDHSRDRGVTWLRESSQPKLFPEATNQFQVGSRRAEQVQQPRPRHQLTSYPRAMRRRGPPGHRLVRRGAGPAVEAGTRPRADTV